MSDDERPGAVLGPDEVRRLMWMSTITGFLIGLVVISLVIAVMITW